MKLFRRFALGLSLLLLVVGVGLLLVSNISLKRHMLLFNYLFLKRESETAYNSVKRVAETRSQRAQREYLSERLNPSR